MNYCIIGNSAAGIGAVEGIRQVDKSGKITLITDESRHTYSRPLISYLLLGKVAEEKMKYRPDSFYSDNDCEVLYAKVTGIDADGKQVVLSDNGKVPYDKLLVATGSSAFTPPFNGLDAVKNRYSFMSLDDALKLEDALGSDKRVLIIGAGLIGLKCAEGILKKVASVTVIDLAPRILPAVLDDYGSGIVQKHMESKGVQFMLSAKVKEFAGNTAILESGEKTDFDVLVTAAGVRPNTALLEGVAEIGKGITVNEKSETSRADIYAAGDCTETLDISSGQKKIMALLPNAYIQGECAGINMAGGSKPKSFGKAIPMNAAGFLGLHIITAGSYEGEEYVHKSGDSYKRLFYANNRLNGYIMVGDVEKAGVYTSLIRERVPLDTLDFPLVCEKPGLMAFGREERKLKLGGVSQ